MASEKQRRKGVLPRMAVCMRDVCFALLFVTNISYAAGLPSDVVKLVPSGFEVLTYQKGQLTDQKRQDYLVAIHRAVDTSENPSPRPLLIITQGIDGTYKLAGRNDVVVLRADEGGQCDPFVDNGDSGFAIKGGYFTVQNGVACGQHWTDYITFRFDPAKRDWLFYKQIVQSWHLNPNDDGEALLADPADIKHADRTRPVTFDAWRSAR